MSPPRDTAGVALVGFGMGGAVFHAPFIDAEPRLRLVSVVTANPGRRAGAGARYPGVRVEPDVGSLLARLDGIDLVVVSTPNASHAEVAGAVLAQGRAVVVDKPVTPTSDETRGLRAMAASAEHRRRALPEPALRRRLPHRRRPPRRRRPRPAAHLRVALRALAARRVAAGVEEPPGARSRDRPPLRPRLPPDRPGRRALRPAAVRLRRPRRAPGRQPRRRRRVRRARVSGRAAGPPVDERRRGRPRPALPSPRPARPPT